MKTILVAILLLVGNFVSAAIEIECLVAVDNDDSGYSTTIVEMSLKEGNKTGVAHLSYIYDNKVDVSISAGADGKPFVGGICVAGASVEICGQERSGLVLSQVGEKTTITCSASGQ